MDRLTGLTLSNLGLAIAVVASWTVVAGVLTSIIGRGAAPWGSRKVIKRGARTQSGERGSKR